MRIKIMPKGTKVKTHDQNAIRYGRVSEKPEAIGVIIDHFRSITNEKSPPYLVRFSGGEQAWYDYDELVRFRRIGKKRIR